MSGMAVALVAEAVRPRGGQAEIVDWNEVIRLAKDRVAGGVLDERARERAARLYNRLAGELRGPLLDVVQADPTLQLPPFQALDRPAWLDLNIGILSRAMGPLTQASRIPNSLLTDVGRAGANRYIAMVLGFLAGRVLGQYDPQLLGREPLEPGLYLVEPNIAGWEAEAHLPGQDLRRWLILHEMTHAWQFAAHPWLRRHLNEALERLVALAAGRQGNPVERLLSVTIGAPDQWRSLRQMQATMSLVEGYSNLVMTLAGRQLLPAFDQLQEAHRRRSGERGVLEALFWRLTGLDLKLQQYQVGEAFCEDVHDLHGMAVLNRAWEGPQTLPRPDELRDPESWYRRIKKL